MKQIVFTLLILLAVAFLGALDAELTETGFVDSYFDATLNYIDTNNILNLYRYAYSNVQQFSIKRVNMDGSEADQLQFDFSEVSDMGSGFRYYTALHRPRAEGESFLFIFYNQQGIVLFNHEGSQLHVKTLLFSSIDDYNVPHRQYFILMDESILILGENNDLEACLWEWGFEGDTISLYYTIPDYFTDSDEYRRFTPCVTRMGEYIVISKYSYPAQVFEEQPVMVLDSSLNANTYYAHIAALGTRYSFSDNAYFAAWEAELYSADAGVIYVDDDSFEYETKVSNDHWFPGSFGINISFRLANSIFGAWYSSSTYDNPTTRRFFLYQLQPNGRIENYTGLPELVNTGNNYGYALNLQGKLLLANYAEGAYTFQLADFEEGEFANWPEGDSWQPDLEGYTLIETQSFSNADYAVFRLTLQDDSGSRFYRYYFLNLEHRVSVSDLVQSPPILKAYPNPFNDSVQISSSKTPNNDELRIYNVKGQRVKTLSSTGADYEWDGCDEHGNRLGAGIYLLRGSAKEKPVKIIKLK